MLWFRKRQIQKNSPCRILPTLKKSCMPPLRSSTVPHCFYLSLQATSPGFIYQEASCGDRDDECNVGRNIIEAHKVSWQGGAFLGKLKTKYRDSSQNPASQHFHLDFHRHRLLTLSSQHQYIHCVYRIYVLWTAYCVQYNIQCLYILGVLLCSVQLTIYHISGVGVVKCPTRWFLLHISQPR